MSLFNTYKALIKREFWEHRGAFIKAPIIIGIVSLVITIVMYITSLVLVQKSAAEDIMHTSIQQLSTLTQEQLSKFWDVGMMVGTTLYLFVLFVVVFFFLLGSLFDDRKDGSILFWKSLPINDANTVLSKLLTAMIFVPLAFIVIYLLFTLINMLLFSVVLIFHGQNPIPLVWLPYNIFNDIKMMTVGALLQMLWALPIYGWLLLSSAISKRRPILFAIFIPTIIAFSWYWINMLSFKFTNVSMFEQPLQYFGHAMLPYSSGVNSAKFFSFSTDEGSAKILSNMLTSIADIRLLYGAIICTILVVVAIWLRRYRNST
ncbi:MAG: hypothetical protein L3J53_02245 [Proteobacteria bacterium]|nr:hypothetical protein [Pseudomonadota bacterium]